MIPCVRRCLPSVDAVDVLPRTSSAPLFFSCSDDRRVLPSFPTRRSSDLAVSPQVFRDIHACVSGERPVTAALGDAADEERSEEHTSELQSLTNLVCRLLLEKKNAATIGMRKSGTLLVLTAGCASHSMHFV